MSSYSYSKNMNILKDTNTPCACTSNTRDIPLDIKKDGLKKF